MCKFERLPKCIVARIDKIWYPKVPTGYPASSSIFAFVTGENKNAVNAMEENLYTEDSIISAEDLPEHTGVYYAGTFDVEAEPGEETLLSPVKLPEDSLGAVAYHYNSDADEWQKIEEVEVKDGYVWGTLEEFSPVAVFAIKRRAYYDTSKSQLATDVYVCNGIPTRIYKDEEGKAVADSNGIITEIEEGCSVVGGSYDGTPIESTNVLIDGVEVFYAVAGSFTYGDSGEENKNHTKTAKLTIKNAKARCVNGAGIWNCVDDVEINVINTEITSGLGNQISYYQTHCSNKTLEDSETGKYQYVKNSMITVKDSKVYVGYAGGHSGNSYTKYAELYAENSEFEYYCNGQSNGTIDDVKSTLVGCKVKYLNNNNRGHYGSGNLILKGGNEIEYGYVFTDPADDKQMADIRGKVSWDINKGDKIESYEVGAIANVKITTAEEAAKYIDVLKASRDADITYTDNADVILKDIIRIK